MTDWDYIQIGWRHADIAASWALGVLAYVATLAAGAWVLYRLATVAGRWLIHRVRVRRIRRDNRRAGRDIINRSVQRAHGADV